MVACIRVRIDFVQEATPVLFVKNSGETPELLLEGLDVLNLDDEDISWLSAFDLEWAC